ncbi:MAG: ATP-dependent zinc protease [Leptospiraceae bacterium]|nr:ATP-dependent zinc protease [Leptospiraceae bacterium]MCP5496849.1 ATP-dependent zinc protease [Leptospiraceae bacterium]
MKYFLLFISFSLCFLTVPMLAETKFIVGWAEKVKIFPGNFTVKARIDTGAKTSSINTPFYETFEKDGKTWVRFDFMDKKGKKKTIEKEVLRTSKIKRKGMKSEERPVVKLEICLGNVYKESEVNLVDRSNFNYQILIGRSYLENDFLVDSSSRFTKKPNCKIPGKK